MDDTFLHASGKSQCNVHGANRFFLATSARSGDPGNPDAKSAADAAANAGWEQGSSDIALLAPSIAPLPALFALARGSAGRRSRVRYAVMAPNLLCVAGAFAFGFTPMAAVFLSNFGTSLAYSSAKRALGMSAAMRLDRFARGYPIDENGAGAQPNLH